tara:strand:+ start:1268 stop:2035 length:768 start_codon:yes stop_codon:yes gene_type:complete
MDEPDWKKEEDYEYTKEFNGDPAAWAWEFLRRNPNYLADYANLQSGEFKAKGFIPSKSPNETQRQWQSRCIQNDVDPVILSPEQNLARKWGLRFFLHDPSLTAVELAKEGRAVEFDTDVKPTLLEKWDDIESIATVEEEGGVVVVSHDRLVISFDLNGPVDPQVKLMKKWFDERKLSVDKAKKPQAHTFKNCLRVLDAMFALGDKFKNHLVRDALFPEDGADTDVKIHNLIATARINSRTAYKAIAKRRTRLKII